MKKILGLTIAALLVMTLVGGGTWAYFSDPEASTGNILTAGTLNLVPAMNGSIGGTTGTYAINTALSDGVDGSVTFDKVSPGNTGTVEWVLYNSGSLAGTLSLAGTTVTFNDNDGSEMEPETTAIASNGAANLGLGDLMGVWVEKGTGSSQAAAEGALTNLLGTTTAYQVLSSLEAALQAITVEPMAATGGNNYVVFILHWSLLTDLKKANVGVLDGTGAVVDDNIIQGDSATINVGFVLTQVNP